MPILLLFAGSVERVDTATFQVIERFTLHNYRKFLFDRFYLGVLGTTLRISVLVTLAALVTGYPVASYLQRARPRERAALMLLIVSPLLVSLVIRSYGWVIVLGPRGLVNNVLAGLHLVSAPLKLIYTETAVVVGLTHVFYPFMVLAIYSSLQTIDPAVVRAAQNLGASPRMAFWRVTLPLSVPGIVAGSLIVFALSVSSFVTPALARRPVGEGRRLPRLGAEPRRPGLAVRRGDLGDPARADGRRHVRLQPARGAGLVRRRVPVGSAAWPSASSPTCWSRC